MTRLNACTGAMCPEAALSVALAALACVARSRNQP